MERGAANQLVIRGGEFEDRFQRRAAAYAPFALDGSLVCLLRTHAKTPPMPRNPGGELKARARFRHGLLTTPVSGSGRPTGASPVA